jgi:hypothetical protein
MGSLLEIVGLEPDPSIAMSVVLRMVERVPEAERILGPKKSRQDTSVRWPSCACVSSGFLRL